MDLLTDIDNFNLGSQEIGFNQTTGDYSLAGQFVRGPYHYGKSYYTNFIKYDNRKVYHQREARRSQFIPQGNVNEKTFKERFEQYLDKLTKESNAKKLKKASKAIVHGLIHTFEAATNQNHIDGMKSIESVWEHEIADEFGKAIDNGRM